MIRFLEGNLISKDDQSITLMCSNFGWQLPMPTTCLAQLNDIGSVVRIYLSWVWKETGPQVYGFSSMDQVNIFETLHSVSGVGPKTALAMMSHMTHQALDQAFSSSDVKLLSQVPGIGKKTAERILLELKDKWKPVNRFIAVPSKNFDKTSQDAINALVNLGHSQLSAQKLVENVLENHPEATHLPEIISLALRTKNRN